MIRRLGIISLLGLTLLLGRSSRAWALTADDADTVTMDVNAVLSISDTVGNFTLTFSDYVSGTDSSTQVVNYLVKANNVALAATTGIVSAKISALIQGIDLKGDVGTITNDGTDGNILLTESASGFTTMTTSATNMADKGVTSGDQGGVLRGTVPITWKGTTTVDRKSGTDNVTLTVTVKDI